jgi:hypothetical protein
VAAGGAVAVLPTSVGAAEAPPGVGVGGAAGTCAVGGAGAGAAKPAVGRARTCAMTTRTVGLATPAAAAVGARRAVGVAGWTEQAVMSQSSATDRPTRSTGGHSTARPAAV